MNPKYIYTSYFNKVSAKEDFNTEKFIVEIQRRECMWNNYSKCYNLKRVRNKEIRRKAWEEVGKVMYANWDCLTEEEKQKKVAILSKKWTNIRKYHSDELRNPSNGLGKKRRRSYHHLLSFLDDTVLKRRVPLRHKEFQNINQTAVEDISSDSDPGQLSIVEDADEVRRLSNRYDADEVRRLSHRYDAALGSPDQAAKINKCFESEPTKDVNLWKNLAPTRPVDDKMAANNETGQKNPEIVRLLNESRNPQMKNNNIYNQDFRIQPLSSAVSPRPHDDTSESSKRFLLSLLPELMTLNDKQHLQFRLGILELLNKIKLRGNPNANPTVIPNDNFK